MYINKYSVYANSYVYTITKVFTTKQNFKHFHFQTLPVMKQISNLVNIVWDVVGKF